MATVYIRVSIHQMQLALLAIIAIHDDGLAVPDDRNATHIKHSCRFEFSIAPER